MNIKAKIIASLFLVCSAITVLVMLNISFEQFDEKYLPSFLAAQKFALPVVLSAMSVGYLFFFEPERLQKKSAARFLKILLVITLLLYSYYLTTLNLKVTDSSAIALFLLQWIVTGAMTAYSFFLPPKL